VAPYELPTDDETEAYFQSVGFSRNDDIVPSQVGLPSKGGFGDNFDEEVAKFFDDSKPSPRELEELKKKK
jgi:hypothetical protein